MIEDRSCHLNELQALYEWRCNDAIQQLWPGMEQLPDTMWPPIYVMRLEGQKQFEEKWYKDHPEDEKKPGYNKVNVKRWQIKEVIKGQPEWRLRFIAHYRTIQDYADALRELRIDPTSAQRLADTHGPTTNNC